MAGILHDGTLRIDDQQPIVVDSDDQHSSVPTGSLLIERDTLLQLLHHLSDAKALLEGIGASTKDAGNAKRDSYWTTDQLHQPPQVRYKPYYYSGKWGGNRPTYFRRQ